MRHYLEEILSELWVSVVKNESGYLTAEALRTQRSWL